MSKFQVLEECVSATGCGSDLYCGNSPTLGKKPRTSQFAPEAKLQDNTLFSCKILQFWFFKIHSHFELYESIMNLLEFRKLSYNCGLNV